MPKLTYPYRGESSAVYASSEGSGEPVHLHTGPCLSIHCDRHQNPKFCLTKGTVHNRMDGSIRQGELRIYLEMST